MALPTKNRLKKKRDFNRIFKEGRAVKGDFLFIKFLKNNQELSRFGIIVPAGVFAKPVDRNRIKRVLSEVLRQRLDGILGFDAVVVLTKKDMEEKIKQELILLLNNLMG